MHFIGPPVWWWLFSQVKDVICFYSNVTGPFYWKMVWKVIMPESLPWSFMLSVGGIRQEHCFVFSVFSHRSIGDRLLKISTQNFKCQIPFQVLKQQPYFGIFCQNTTENWLNEKTNAIFWLPGSYFFHGEYCLWGMFWIKRKLFQQNNYQV